MEVWRQMLILKCPVALFLASSNVWRIDRADHVQ